MSFGLTLGLGVAVAVYLSGAGPGFAPRVSTSAPNHGGSGDRRPAAHEAARGRAAEPPGASHPAASVPPDRGPNGTKFDFYKILPRSQVVVPEVETPTQPPPAAAPVETPGKYVLQAGSFRSYGEADRLRASLALLGIESRIQRVTIDDDEFHRVRIGPIDDLDTLNRVRNQLRGAGITPVLMRVDNE